jgi:Fur family ferric uptake transcriptional regulator
MDSAQRLRAHGLHVTAQRLAILRAVALHPHGSADTIAKAARCELGSLSQQPALFDPRADDRHHHAVCRTCARVTDIDVSEVDAARALATCGSVSSHSGYRIDEAEVVYWGHCPTCLASGATTQSV